MKQLKINVFSFDELSKEVQDKIIERERWSVMVPIQKLTTLSKSLRKSPTRMLAAMRLGIVGIILAKSAATNMPLMNLTLKH